MIAQFIQREVYGNVLYYPHNDIATKLCRFLNVKSMPKKKFVETEALGFKIEIINQYEIKRD